MNLRLITIILTILGSILGLNATIVKHRVLQAPNLTHQIYLYFDVHLPLLINQKQYELTVNNLKKTKKTTVLAECTSFDLQDPQAYQAVRTKFTYSFPEAVVSKIQRKIEKFAGAPGNRNDQFLPKLEDNLRKNPYGHNIVFADDNRLTINNGLHYLWMMGWLIPVADLIGFETKHLEKGMIFRNGGDDIFLEDLLEKTHSCFQTYLNELRAIVQKNKGDKQLLDTIETVKSLISTLSQISINVKKFAGPKCKLSQFRKKAKQHASELIKKIGPTNDLLNQQLEDVLGKEFNEFFPKAIKTYISNPYNALDATLLHSILNHSSKDPICVYVGGAHARTISTVLEKQGYKILEESAVRIKKNNEIKQYPDFIDYLKNTFTPDLSYNAAELKKINDQFLGPEDHCFFVGGK